jgi:hypothetical protein
MGGQASSDSDIVFAELAHERFCRPRPTTVFGPMDELRQAFVDRTFEVSMHDANKATARATFAKTAPHKPPGQDAKAGKAAADKHKATPTAQATGATGTKPSDGTKPPTKK